MERTEAAESVTVLKILSGAAFFVLFNSFLMAPIIPSLAKEFNVGENLIGLAVPAFLIPYGVSTLFYGPLSDRIGRKNVILILLFGAIFSTALSGLVQTAYQLIAMRVLMGLSAGGIIPIILALVADLFPYKKRGNAMGWIFGAVAGGSAFGSTLGAALNPVIGWRLEFFCLALANAVVFSLAFQHRSLLGKQLPSGAINVSGTVTGYIELIKDRRALRTYLFIFSNGLFQSGVFSWLGLYFSRRYQLGDYGIGLALLGYGIPGMLCGPFLGRLADKRGRNRLIPAGFIVQACCALALAPAVPLGCAAAAVTILSLGFDMSHPPMVGIVSTLNPQRRGLAMGMNAFVLFTGLGFGALVFQMCLAYGLSVALTTFGVFELSVGILAIFAFAQEKAATPNTIGSRQ